LAAGFNARGEQTAPLGLPRAFVKIANWANQCCAVENVVDDLSRVPTSHYYGAVAQHRNDLDALATVGQSNPGATETVS
jgi:hypothetical protein